MPVHQPAKIKCMSFFLNLKVVGIFGCYLMEGFPKLYCMKLPVKDSLIMIHFHKHQILYFCRY